MLPSYVPSKRALQGPKVKYVLIVLGILLAYFVVRQYYYDVKYTEKHDSIDISKFKPIKKFEDPEGCPKIRNCDHLKCKGDDYDRVIRIREDNGCRECACQYVPIHDED